MTMTVAPAPDCQPDADRRWRVFHRSLTGLVLAAVATLVATNILVDPYGVFGARWLADGAELNERVVKHRRLTQMPAAPDVILMGSSVMGVVPPAAIAPGRTSFNLSFFSATPADIQQMLDSLERAARLPRTVVIGIDPFMLSRPDLTSPQMRLPPDASGVDRLTFWKEYVLAGSAKASLNKVVDHFVGRPGVVFDRQTGEYRLAAYDAHIARDHEEFMRRRFGAPSWSTARPSLDPALADLQRLLAWTRARPTLEVVWVMHPLHHSMRSALGPWGESYRTRVKALLGPRVVDLTDAPMTEDDRLWYEPKHFRAAAMPAIAPAIADALSITNHLAAQ